MNELPPNVEPRRVVSVDGTIRNALEQAQLRLIFVGVVFAFCCVVVVGRLTELAVFKHSGDMIEHAEAVHGRDVGRADIVDRHGELLATSLITASLYADPVKILDPKEAAHKLVATFPDLSYGEILQKLQSEQRFVWLKRNLTPKQQYAVQSLGLPGLDFRQEETRIYPFGADAVHVVGYTNVDGKGMAGIEESFNSLLNAGNKPLELSIDNRIQHIMKRELAGAIQDYQAIGGAGMVMDVHTGEILAMVSLPDFDPHGIGQAPDDAKFNRNTLGVYEMGSTFKVFNTAIALESGKVQMQDSFDATHPLHIGRFTIDDFEPKHRWLSVPEIFMYSSNIGSVQMALTFGTDLQQRYLSAFGLSKSSPIELPEIGAPLVPRPWNTVNTMTIAFGHGMSVSPIQLITAVSAVVNGGVLHKPTLIKRPAGTAEEGTQVISEKTSEEMRRLMRLQVVGGTGKQANIAGYMVGGKTGTADKVVNGAYGQHARLSSFVGVFPMTAPRYLVFAMVDEPKPNAHSYGFATGGWVAAPAVGHVIAEIGPLLGVKPIEETPAIASEMEVDTVGKVKRVAFVN